jgi:metal-responsive CopG/Arc/MetJ family transcriptional regulator
MGDRVGGNTMGKKKAGKPDKFVSVKIPAGTIERVDKLVDAQIFASRSQGVVALITAGLKDYT